MKNKLSALFEAVIYYVIYLFSGIIGNVAAIAVATVIIGIEYVSNNMLVDNAVFFEEVMSFVRSEVALGILLANLAVLFIYQMAFRNRSKKLGVYTGMHKVNAFNMLAAALAGFFAHGLVVVVLEENLKSATEIIQEYEHQMEWMQGANIWLLLAVTVFVAPLVEEIVFRGVLIPPLQKVITPIGALLITSLLFGCAHGNIVQGIYSFVLGLMLGFVRIRSGSLWNTIIMHITFNASNIMSAVFGVTVAWMPIGAIVLFLLVLIFISSRPIGVKNRI